MELLGNPQNSYPVIHIMGTSWKWSTATILSHICVQHGYKTWLHISPHLQDIRERCQINNSLVSKESFVETFDSIQDAITACAASAFWEPTYFEILTAMYYVHFAKIKVDVAIVEAWCWGLYDWSNVVSNPQKICIITKQWLDHQNILGNSLEEITFNDAWSIWPWNEVVSLYHEEQNCRDIVSYTCQQKNARLTRVTHWSTFCDIQTSREKTQFVYTDIQNIPHTFSTNLIGSFQAENASLALRAFEIFSKKQEQSFSPQKTQNALANIHRWWRCERVQKWKTSYLLDGAHNIQKMQHFIQTVQNIYTETDKTFVISFKDWKDWKEMLDILATATQQLIYVDFETTQDFYLHSVAFADIQQYLNDVHPDIQLTHKTLEHCFDKTTNLFVVTGSLYFVGHVKDYLQL